MKKTIHSGYDKDGRLFVACSECSRGGNGDQSCGAGGRHKRYHGQMCFCGQPLQWVQDALLFIETQKQKRESEEESDINDDGEWETIFERDADGKVIVNDHPRKDW